MQTQRYKYFLLIATNGRHSSKNVEIFKNNAIFFNFNKHISTVHPTSSVTVYCDKTCLLQFICYTALENNTLHKFQLKVTELIDARARIYRESVRLICLTFCLRPGFTHLMYLKGQSLDPVEVTRDTTRL